MEKKEMDKDCKHHNSAGFSNGFLLGTLVGGGLVFLIGTKKGKQILKALTENGFEGISELTELLGDDEDDAIVDEYIQDVENESRKETPKATKSIKRFFKRIKK